MDRPFAGWIGVGRRDISPPTGIFFRNWGAAAHDQSLGLHRPLTVTVLALQDAPAGQPLLLVAIDLGWHTAQETEWVLREPLLDRFELDASRVMVCLSHSHATPSISLDDAGRPGGDLIPRYADHVVAQLVAAAEDAVAGVTPATLHWRYGRCDLATNRDLPAPDGSRTLTGYNPRHPADDTLLVGRVTRDDNGQTLATLVNYACHPTTLAWQNRLVSPDYVGAMRQVVEAHEPGSFCLFMQGASGDLAPAEQYTGDLAVADRHGARLGHAVVATLLGMDRPGHTLTYDGVVESGAVLAMWKQTPVQADRTLASQVVAVAMPMKPMPSLEEIDRELAACQDRALAERLLRKRRRLAYFKGQSQWDVPLYAWRVGGAILMGHAMEAYSQWQVGMRAQWPGRPVAAINLVNGSLGYIVPEALCDPGLYAWWQTLFAEASFSRLVAASHATGQSLLAMESKS